MTLESSLHTFTFFQLNYIIVFSFFFFALVCSQAVSGRRGRNRMVVGFPTTCAFSTYHH